MVSMRIQLSTVIKINLPRRGTIPSRAGSRTRRRPSRLFRLEKIQRLTHDSQEWLASGNVGALV